MKIIKLLEDWNALYDIAAGSHKPYNWNRKIGYDDEGVELLEYTFPTDEWTDLDAHSQEKSAQ